jgi:hypothetical protein
MPTSTAARLILVALVLLPGSGSSRLEASVIEAAGDPRDAWARVLATYHSGGGLDYAALQGDRQDLDLFLGSLASAKPEAMDLQDQIAFWINAYNAVVVHHVLEAYPGIGSVKEVEGFFDELRFPVAGEQLTLDEIENRARVLGDPRVHFAVVCASTSCPDLRPEPYRGQLLEAQLESSTRAFLADTTKGLAWERSENTLELSSIFKWYAGDFTGGSTVIAFFVRGRVLDWILPHLPADLAGQLDSLSPSVRYMDYDWSLNDHPRSE